MPLIQASFVFGPGVRDRFAPRGSERVVGPVVGRQGSGARGLGGGGVLGSGERMHFFRIADLLGPSLVGGGDGVGPGVFAKADRVGFERGRVADVTGVLDAAVANRLDLAQPSRGRVDGVSLLGVGDGDLLLTVGEGLLARIACLFRGNGLVVAGQTCRRREVVVLPARVDLRPCPVVLGLGVGDLPRQTAADQMHRSSPRR